MGITLLSFLLRKKTKKKEILFCFFFSVVVVSGRMNCFYCYGYHYCYLTRKNVTKKNSNDFATGSSFGRSCSYLIRLPLRGLLLRYISPFPYHVSSTTFTIQFDVDSPTLPHPSLPTNFLPSPSHPLTPPILGLPYPPVTHQLSSVFEQHNRRIKKRKKS